MQGKNTLTNEKHYALALLLVMNAAVFALMLVCNFHTGLIADDFSYLFNFGDDWYWYDPPYPAPTASRITRVGQILWSMECHRSCMNGRVIAHFFVQLFLLLPKWIFNILNSFAFVLELLMLCKCALIDTKREKGRNPWILPLLFAFSFASIWLFQLHFGQVNLWLDGAINYLWSAVIALSYIYGYINLVLKGHFSRSVIINLAFITLSFVTGAYGENSAGAMLVFAFCMIGYKLITERKVNRHTVLAIVSFAATAAGFIYLLTAPIELMGKMSDKPLLEQIVFGSWLLWQKALPLIPYLCGTLLLYVLAIMLRADKKRLIIVGFLIFSALASALCLVLATYIALRSLYITLTLLTVSNTIVIAELIKCKKPTAILCTVLTLALIAALPKYLVTGVRDIFKTYEITTATEEYIISCAENGIENVYIESPPGLAETKYSPLNGLVFLDKDNDTFPNRYMAKYYGVKTVNLIS